MILVLIIAAVLWWGGARLRWPVARRVTAVGLLWATVVGLHFTLPEGHRLRMATGNDARIWLILAGFAAIGAVYFFGIGKLKKAVNLHQHPPAAEAFRPAELDRYARHIMLREIGGAGQRKLKDAKILVIGAGGLGSPALLYLAAAGVGVIGVIDDDVVEGSNLQRQIIHTDQRIGIAKVTSAADAMTALNPFIEVRPYQRRLTADIAAALISDYDLVLDGSDNFDTRYLVNRACVETGRPLISGAITQWEGQLSLFHPAQGAACYECIFPVRPAPGLVPTCAEAGVAAPLPGVIGAMMAMEAVKHITGAGLTLAGRLLIYDALFAETRVIGIKRRVDCAVCASAAALASPPGDLQ